MTVQDAPHDQTTKLRVAIGNYPQTAAFKNRQIASSRVALDLVVMDGERFGERQVICHSASFLYKLPNFSWLPR